MRSYQNYLLHVLQTDGLDNLPYIDIKPARRIRLRLPPDEDKFLAYMLTKDKRFTSCHLGTFFKSQLYPTTGMKGY